MQKLLRYRIKLTLCHAPYVLHENFPDVVPTDIAQAKHYLGKLVKEDYITHHLYDDNTLAKIVYGWQDVKKYLS